MARNAENPLVGVIMGSDSDLPHIYKAGHTLEDFDVPYEYRILSAHRTPDRMSAYAKAARDRGLKVIIAAAGGSAHLQGMTGSEAVGIPVLGIAVESSPDTLNSAFGSMLRMPEGKPLATMGKSSEKSQAGAVNAALMAISILALNDEELFRKLDAYNNHLRESVVDKDTDLSDSDHAEYVSRRLGKSIGR